MHAQEVARRISGAVAGEVFAQVKTYQVPITNSSPSHLHYFPFASRFPLPPLPPCCFIRPLFPNPLSFSLVFCVLVAMASPLSTPLYAENEVLNFKQRDVENLKDAWFRICNAQNRSIRKQSTFVLLRNFYVGITPWNRYILDTIIRGNFLGSHTFDSYNAMIDPLYLWVIKPLYCVGCEFLFVCVGVWDF